MSEKGLLILTKKSLIPFTKEVFWWELIDWRGRKTSTYGENEREVHRV